MTTGEKYIYDYVSDGMVKSSKEWRGSHTLRVYYRDQWPTCHCCNQAVRIDADTAYEMFMNAKIEWNGTEISHEQLRGILLGQKEGAVNSGGRFRNAGSYGIDPFREWGRRELGREIVLADLDIAVRRYGRRFGLDESGDLMLIEKKEVWPSRESLQESFSFEAVSR